MRFSGHTNATYGYTTEQSIELFARLGFEGFDIGCNELSGITIDTPLARRREIARFAQARGIPVTTLACYAGEDAGFTSLDSAVRLETIRQVKEHVRLAADLGCERVRVFPGRDKGKGIAERAGGFEQAVLAYRELSDFAGDHGVTLLVENHPATITITARQTVELVKAVDRANVRILYDPSNLIVYAGDQDVEGNFRIQRDLIAYAHMKDQLLLDDGTYKDTVIGRGVIPWGKLLRLLHEAGYKGFLAMEYQRGLKSTQNLPDPDVGLKEGLVFLRRTLEATEAAVQ